MRMNLLVRGLGGTAMAALLCAGTAQAALQARDLDKNGVTDAFYDTDLNITWLRNANVNGLMYWEAASSWAAGFSFAGYDDWRLPTSGGCVGFNCSDSEMSHLYYIGLGNQAGGPLSNTGGFQNLLAQPYWSSTYSWPLAYGFHFVNGYQNPYAINYESGLYALAVRDGDVTPVPEPGALALLLLGLAGLAAVRSRS